MIIELKLKNWMSFRDETVFSLAATSEKRLRDRLPKIRKNPVLNVSPIAALYGGNASGKTNFFKLIAFLKQMVVFPIYDVNKNIPLESFILAPESDSHPSEISLTFLTADDKIYTLELSLTRKEILHENLFLIKRSGPIPIYSRVGNKVELQLDSLRKDKNALAFAQVVSRNQLYLGIAGGRVAAFQYHWQWFRDQLTLISTQSAFRGYMDMFATQPTDIQMLANLLKDLDTGICQLAVEESTFSAMPEKLNETEIKERLEEGAFAEFNFNGLRFIVTKENGQLLVKKMISFHKNSEGNLVKFDLRQESEGSLRLLDILPAFIDLEKQNSHAVYVIDELDCSWHYALSRRLLGIYLSNCSENSRTQLLFSTHDLLLMDQDLFRRDEMWITERKEDGSSTLFSLACCNIRYDKDIRKMYLQGALGGIPQLARFGSLLDKEEK